MTITEQSPDQSNRLQFPANFIWGSATAAYQIEGAVNEDGRKPSIWDTFSRTPGKVLNGDTGDIACDHYHRYRSDVALMKQLNLGAYRFSIAWPRILPDGRGAINEKGLDFYDRLTDELLQAGIKPYATLYHWDLPQALEDQGGWTNRATAEAFVEYADIVSRRLGDRISSYTTFNEPWCSAVLGYGLGIHAPGLTDPALQVAATHHLLLAHGLAVPVIRRNAPQAEVGITLNLWSFDPASDSPADRQAAEEGYDLDNRVYLDPIFRGEYPQTYLNSLPDGVTVPVQPGDFEIMKTPVDFLGINYYIRHVRKAEPGVVGGEEVKLPGIYTTMDWEVYPPGLYDLLVRLNREYPLTKIYVTENGSSGEEAPDANGKVHDRLRHFYIQEHLVQSHRAIQEGVPLAGYFAWSLMDNYEWAWGYTRRFGIVYVDYSTQQRTIKDSGFWYAGVARDNALPDTRVTYP
ncbi:MAG: beta-glucosidase [Chloroflexi bacterium]|nr:beta-glucosidase [Chloroflexota bacterium]OJV89934.1 MAG: beta-glucosidase [Chloroflexi bacterium 54-19]